MYCVKCGKEITDSSKFCPFCGEQIPANEVVTPSIQEATDDLVLSKNLTQDIQPESNISEFNPEIQPEFECPQSPEIQPEFESPQSNPEIQTETAYSQSNPEVQSQPSCPQYNPEFHADTECPQNIPETQPQPDYPQYNPEVQYQSVYQQNNQEIQPNKKKKKGIKVLVIVLAAVILVAGGCVGGYFIYQNFLDKQAVKVITLLDDDNFEESTSVYKKYCSGKEKLRKQVEDELLVRIEESQKEYELESKTYQEVIDFYSNIEEYDNSVLNEEVEEARDWVNMINDSRDNYEIAHSAFVSEDYETALDYYIFVIPEDSEYYTKAQEESSEAQVKLEEQWERERLETLKQDAIMYASNYASYDDYDNAIYEIQQALISLPEDSELLELLNNYESLKKEAEESAKAERVDEAVLYLETFDDTYYEGDMIITTIEYTLPNIKDDTPAYQLINSDMKTKKEEFIAYADAIAESARLYCTEDYFYPSSLYSSCYVGYNDGGIIAFTFNCYDYIASIGSIDYYESYMYNLATGQRIGLQDILAISEYDFQQLVAKKYERLISSGTEFYPDVLDTVLATNVNNYSYYLSYDGLHIYYGPYIISDYFTEVVIDYEGVVNFIND